jgi:hypothetical protein
MTKMAGVLCYVSNAPYPHICHIHIIHHTIETFVQTTGARSQTKMAIPDLDLIKQEKQATALAGASADRPKPTASPIEITPLMNISRQLAGRPASRDQVLSRRVQAQTRTFRLTADPNRIIENVGRGYQAMASER